MKKFLAVLPVLALVACGIHAGNINVAKNQNSIFEMMQTSGITYYIIPHDEEFLTTSKTITEEELHRGEILITETGDIMAFSKTYRTDFYNMEVLRVNKDAVLDSSYSPYYIKKNAEYTGFGEVMIDDVSYMLVRQGKNDNDVLLINSDGEIYNRIGRVRKGRLALIDATFFASPDDVRFEPVISTRSEKSDYLDGFELRYNGVKSGNMKFTYTTLGEDCYDEEFVFPATQQIINIKNLKIKVLDAEYNKIEYIIL